MWSEALKNYVILISPKYAQFYLGLALLGVSIKDIIRFKYFRNFFYSVHVKLGIGTVIADFFQERAFLFLKKALMNFDDSMPFRGPKEFVDGDFKYTFEMNVDYSYFLGQECIFYKGE